MEVNSNWAIPNFKNYAVKLLHSSCQQIWKTQQWPQDWKRSVYIPIPKTGNAKECSNYHTIALISHASKVMLKIIQAGFQQYVNCELPDVQAGFTKGRGTRDQIANICWIIRKAREIQKNLYFCFIDCGTFTESSSRIWNSSTGILSPPLALFLVMLPKAHLTSHSRMSGSRWVITTSWLYNP